MLSPQRISIVNPHYKQWGQSINHHDRTPPDARLIGQTKAEDSCYYDGRRYQIKRIGHSTTTLVEVSEYIRNGFRRKPGLNNPVGFNVPTNQIYHIRFNHWNT